MFLSFFRLSVLAFEVGERHVQRPVPEADSDDLLTSELPDHPEIRTKFDQHKRVYRYLCGETSYKPTYGPE